MFVSMIYSWKLSHRNRVRWKWNCRSQQSYSLSNLREGHIKFTPFLNSHSSFRRQVSPSRFTMQQFSKKFLLCSEPWASTFNLNYIPFSTHIIYKTIPFSSYLFNKQGKLVRKKQAEQISSLKEVKNLHFSTLIYSSESLGWATDSFLAHTNCTFKVKTSWKVLYYDFEIRYWIRKNSISAKERSEFWSAGEMQESWGMNNVPRKLKSDERMQEKCFLLYLFLQRASTWWTLVKVHLLSPTWVWIILPLQSICCSAVGISYDSTVTVYLASWHCAKRHFVLQFWRQIS